MNIPPSTDQQKKLDIYKQISAFFFFLREIQLEIDILLGRIVNRINEPAHLQPCFFVETTLTVGVCGQLSVTRSDLFLC